MPRSAPVVTAAALAALLLGCKDERPAGGETESTSESATGGETEAATSGATEASGATQGGTDGDTEDGAGPSPAIEQLVAARCDWLFGCCDAGEFGLAVGPFTADAADCSARVLQALATGNQAPPITAGPSDLLVLLGYSYAAGNISLMQSGVAACAEFLRTEPCAEPPPPPDEDEDEGGFCVPGEAVVDDPCELDLLVLGVLAEGEACEPTLGVECADGLSCVRVGQSGVCVASSVDGDYCFSDFDCTAPLYCDPKNGVCQTASGLGEPCEFENPDNPAPGTETQRCEPELACDPVGKTCVGPCDTGSPCTAEADCPMGHDCVLARCVQKKAAGEPCVVGAECNTGFCQAQTCAPKAALDEPCVPHAQCNSGFCHPFTNTCRPQRPQGQACTSFSDAECRDGVCDNSDPTQPVCVAFAGEGEPCTTTAECSQESELECVDLTCQPTPLQNGSSCTTNTQCASELCWELACDDPAAIGDPCTTAFDPLVKPCGTDAFCDVPAGDTMGTCAAKASTGEICTGDDECWGTCRVNWGQTLCDETPAVGEAWCDGI